VLTFLQRGSLTHFVLCSVNQKKEDKRKSNLELFKEELKVIQLEREQRHAVKRARTGISAMISLSPERIRPSRSSRFQPVDDKMVASVSSNPSCKYIAFFAICVCQLYVIHCYLLLDMLLNMLLNTRSNTIACDP